MQFDGSVIKEQGVTFAIVVVKPSVIQSVFEQRKMRNLLSGTFGYGVPIILMAQNNRGVPTYQGRKDIVNFLVKVAPSRIPWKSYSISQSKIS